MGRDGARANRVSIICGGRNSGKTTDVVGLTVNNGPVLPTTPESDIVVEGFLRFYQRTKPTIPQLIIDLSDHPSYRHIETLTNVEDLQGFKSGVARMFNRDGAAMVNLINKHCRNMVLYVEDATRFLEGGISKSVKDLVLDTKQRNIDVVFMFHGMDSVPPKVAKWCDWLYLKKTGELFTNETRKKFPKAEQVHKRVEAHKNQYYSESLFVGV